jgi:hypothetical protein
MQEQRHDYVEKTEFSLKSEPRPIVQIPSNHWVFAVAGTSQTSAYREAFKAHFPTWQIYRYCKQFLDTLFFSHVS